MAVSQERKQLFSEQLESSAQGQESVGFLLLRSGYFNAVFPRAVEQNAHRVEPVSSLSSRHRRLETSLDPPRNRFPDSRSLILPSSLFVRHGPELRNGKVQTLGASIFCLLQMSINRLTESQDESLCTVMWGGSFEMVVSQTALYRRQRCPHPFLVPKGDSGRSGRVK